MHMTARALNMKVQRRNNDGEKKTCLVHRVRFRNQRNHWNEHVMTCFQLALDSNGHKFRYVLNNTSHDRLVDVPSLGNQRGPDVPAYDFTLYVTGDDDNTHRPLYHR
jgi:hypothetical protein